MTRYSETAPGRGELLRMHAKPKEYKIMTDACGHFGEHEKCGLLISHLGPGIYCRCDCHYTKDYL